MQGRSSSYTLKWLCLYYLGALKCMLQILIGSYPEGGR